MSLDASELTGLGSVPTGAQAPSTGGSGITQLTGGVTAGPGSGSQAATVVTVPASAMPALTGDVTTVAGAVATTIGAGKVSNSMLANMAAHTFKGRNTNSTGAPEDVTLAQQSVLLSILGAQWKTGADIVFSAGAATITPVADKCSLYIVRAGSLIANSTLTITNAVEPYLAVFVLRLDVSSFTLRIINSAATELFPASAPTVPVLRSAFCSSGTGIWVPYDTRWIQV